MRVLNNSGSGSLSDVASGITYAADRAHVLNLSLAGVTSPQTLADAINYAAVTRGRLVVAAAGNCGDSNFFLNGCSFKNQPSYPAAYDNAFAVAAVTPGNTRASFSTVGAYVDIAAPGVDIFSTWPNDISPFVDYLAESGTSQAAPHVAGLAALIWARNPGYTAAQVRSTIQVNATDLLTAGLDSETGYGLINVIPSVGLSSLAAAPASAAEPRLESLPKPVDLRDAPIVPGRVLVKFAPAASAAHIERQLSALDGVSVAGAIQDLGTLLLAVPIGQEWATVDRLRALADVEYA